VTVDIVELFRPVGLARGRHRERGKRIHVPLNWQRRLAL